MWDKRKSMENFTTNDIHNLEWGQGLVKPCCVTSPFPP